MIPKITVTSHKCRNPTYYNEVARRWYKEVQLAQIITREREQHSSQTDLAEERSTSLARTDDGGGYLLHTYQQDLRVVVAM